MFLRKFSNVRCHSNTSKLAKHLLHFKTAEFVRPRAQREKFIDVEIVRLLGKKVIVPCENEYGDFISTIFVRPKADGTHRLILNLKVLNKYVAYHHFKMETLQSAINMMTKGCFMASVDFKDAYYSVAIHENYQKYLKFSWNGKLFNFTCLPNGLACAPRLFTKLLKPAYSSLRSNGYLSVSYIDDCYLQGNTWQSCIANVIATVKMFTSLGFLVHPDKSMFEPSHHITFLGFTLNSEEMTVSPTEIKAKSIAEAIKAFLLKKTHTIRELAEIIGKLVAVFPGCLYGPLHYRQIEGEKISALKAAKGDYNAKITISSATKLELKWWIMNITLAKRPISIPKHEILIKSDASLMGWGAVHDNQSTGGRWSDTEKEQHINALETKAAQFALQTFCDKVKNKHIRILIDNTTAVAYINKMGGSHSTNCNNIARDIWFWCLKRNIWLSAAHLPGSKNIEADKASRVFYDNTEWKLNTCIFKNITDKWFMPNIDLFASRLNHQLPRYVAWHPDPGAEAVDAFTLNWGNDTFYAFPPFSLLGKVLQKIYNDKAQGILIVPNWTTQTWYPQLMQLLVTEPLILPKGKIMIQLPYNKDKIHPLHPKLELLACHLSADPSVTKVFQKKH